MNRRFAKEINVHANMDYSTEDNKWNSKILDCYYTNHTTDSVNFSMLIENRILDIEIQIKNIGYPFRPPKVLINIHNYKSLLRNSNLMQKYKTFLKFDKCMCCNSILCKWSPHYGITHILKEIKSNFLIKYRLKNIIFAKYIMEKYLGFELILLYEFV